MSTKYTVSDHYSNYIDLLDLDDDYLMRKLRKRLTSCIYYQIATTGSFKSVRGYPARACRQPTCPFCRLRVKSDESRRLRLARHNLVLAEDSRLTICPILTINIAAHPLEAEPCEIERCRDVAKSAVWRLIRRLERDTGHVVGLYGHLEASAPMLGREVDPIPSQVPPMPDGLYTMLHLHACLISEAPRGELAEICRSEFPGPRRVCFRDRWESQTVDEALTECLGYSIKHLEAIKPKETCGDLENLWWLTRWRTYLRTDNSYSLGLKGSRVDHQRAMLARLDEMALSRAEPLRTNKTRHAASALQTAQWIYYRHEHRDRRSDPIGYRREDFGCDNRLSGFLEDLPSNWSCNESAEILDISHFLNETKCFYYGNYRSQDGPC